MDSQRHERLTELFLAASALEGDARQRYLLEQCAEDESMLAEVLSLFEADERESEWLDEPGPGLLDVLGESRERARGDVIGNYVVEGLIGSGGAGDVYLARQSSPKRSVAIKVMRHGLDRAGALRRFEFESQLLGRLHHPGVAQVYEASVFEERGRRIPYFVMEYVPDARSVTEYAQQTGLDLRARLELFVHICEAVAHGHNQGVVHCDLKPENVLVDRGGQARVIDFGIARATDRDPKRTTIETGLYAVAGTLPYMSPEQLHGQPDKIDQRTDVYSLGVMCYEMLTGTLPLDLNGKSLPEVARIIEHEEPELLGTLDSRLRGDVETIVAKATAKDRERRYATAAELAADVRRYLNDEPIEARRPTTLYQLKKFARRNRGLVTGVVLASLALLLGSVVAVHQAVLASEREATSRWQAYRASIAAATAALENHDVSLARANLEHAPLSHRNWEWHHLRSRLDDSLWAATPEGLGIPATPAFSVGAGEETLSVLRGGVLSRFGVATETVHEVLSAELFAGEPELGLEALLADGRLHVHGPGLAREHELGGLGLPDGALGLALSPGGRFAVLLFEEFVARVEVESGNVLKTWIESGTGLRSFDVAADGRVALASAVRGRPAVWTPEEDALRPLLEIDGFARAVHFSPDATRLAVGLQSAAVGLWDARELTPLVTRDGHQHAVTAVAFAGDERIVTASLDRTLRVWSADELRPLAVLHGHARGVRSVAVSRDGSRLASTGEDGTLRVWKADDLRTDGQLVGHAQLVFPVAFSPDGVRLASGGADGTVRIWNARTHTPVAEIPVPLTTVTGLAFSPDGRRLAVVGKEGYVAFDLVHGRRLCAEAPPLSVGRAVRDVEFLSDSVRVLIPEDRGDARARTWNTSSGALETVELKDHAGELRRCVDPTGRYAVLYSPEGARGETARADSDSGAELVVYDLLRGAPLPLPPLRGAFAFRPAGRYPELAARLRDAPARIGLFDLARAVQVGELAGHSDRIYGASYSPDGTRLATSGRDGTRLWNTGEAARRSSAGGADQGVAELRGHRSFVWSVEWSPDGSQLATGSGDRTVRVWDTRPFSAVDSLRLDEEQRAALRSRVDAMILQSKGPARLTERLPTLIDWTDAERRTARDLLLSMQEWR